MNRLTITLIAAGSLIAGFAGGSLINQNRYVLDIPEYNHRIIRKFAKVSGRLWEFKAPAHWFELHYDNGIFAGLRVPDHRPPGSTG
jgi:hypothetical protein